jgi:hypothetical protein
MFSSIKFLTPVSPAVCVPQFGNHFPLRRKGTFWLRLLLRFVNVALHELRLRHYGAFPKQPLVVLMLGAFGCDRIPVSLHVRNDNSASRPVKLITTCGPLDIDDPQPSGRSVVRLLD